jgi:Glycine-zipper domain
MTKRYETLFVSRNIHMTGFKLKAAFLGIPMLFSAAGSVEAQTPPASSNGLTTPAQSVGLFVFPQKNQTAAVQQQDEVSCYAASKQVSGIDPNHLHNTTVQAAQSTGGGVRGTVGGAAGGAAIGAIAGDAGKGAAIGATVGLLHGLRSQQKSNEQAQQQAAQQTAANQQAQINTFKRAMTTCLESHNYSVK